MLRWHTSSCAEPLIVIEGLEVSCQRCNKSYRFNQESLSRIAAANIEIPPDRPLGQLRLRWPPSVPYESDGELDGAGKTSENYSGPDKTMLSSERCLQNAAHSAIYRHLDSGEFRLICLDSTNIKSDLIHLDLEQYSVDNCPEYEATSYAWGGEDGDSKPSGPIFIGKFYDVALQTKNCLSMLRYLRPSRGIRLVWVDAICIDQSNTQEKELQIAEMRNIYRDASRVVAYLGNDTVQHPRQQHRRMSRLDELEAFREKDAQKINELFHHRYFSRVWVIQELFLAKSVVIPLYDSDYHTDSTCVQRLHVDWNDLKAPWFQHIAGGRDFPRNKFRELLDQTWVSEATDPRDKLFGILGLVNTALCSDKPNVTTPEREQDHALLPDYTLSMQETFIGLVAYLMIVSDQRSILGKAAGRKAAPGFPTWMPDMRDPSIWRSPESPKRDDSNRVQNWYKAIGLCCKHVWAITSGFNDWTIRWRHGQLKYLNDGIWNAESLRMLRALMCVGNTSNGHIFLHSRTAALSTTLIRIIKLSSSPRRVLDSKSLFVFEFVMAQYSLLICTTPIDLDIILDGVPIWVFLQEDDDGYGQIVFFLREARHQSGNMVYELICSCRCWDLLVFRRPRGPDDGDIGVSDPQKGNTAHLDSTLDIPSGMTQTKHADDCDHQKDSLSTSTFWEKPVPYETLYAATSRIDPDAKIEYELLMVFPDGNIRVKDTLPLFQLLADASSPEELDYCQFGQLYASIISQFLSIPCSTTSPCCTDFGRPGLLRCEPSARPWNIFFTIDTTTWARLKKLWDLRSSFGIAPCEVLVNQQVTRIIETDPEDPSETHIIFEGRDIVYRKKEEKDREIFYPKRNWKEHIGKARWMGWSRLGYKLSWGKLRYDLVNEEATVYICFPVSKIVQYMHETDLAKRFFNLSKFRAATGQDETTMAQSTEESYRNVFGHSWPESLREEIGLIGEPCRIQII